MRFQQWALAQVQLQQRLRLPLGSAHGISAGDIIYLDGFSDDHRF